jgi:hypothetical protein
MPWNDNAVHSDVVVNYRNFDALLFLICYISSYCRVVRDDYHTTLHTCTAKGTTTVHYYRE